MIMGGSCDHEMLSHVALQKSANYSFLPAQ